MLNLTQRAEEHLLRLRAARGLGGSHAARFFAQGSSLGVTFVATRMGDDCLVDGAALPIFISVEASELIDHGVIDAASSGDVLTLFVRPRAGAAGAVVIRASAGEGADPSRADLEPVALQGRPTWPTPSVTPR